MLPVGTFAAVLMLNVLLQENTRTTPEDQGKLEGAGRIYNQTLRIPAWVFGDGSLHIAKNAGKYCRHSFGVSAV